MVDDKGPSGAIEVIGAIRSDGAGGFRFSHRYKDACPLGEATLWAMSDGTVRWLDPSTVASAG